MNRKKLESFPHQKLPFKDLPQTHQDALIHYMSVDGAAWAVEDNWEDWTWGEGKPDSLEERAKVMADINKFRQRFIDAYGEQMFGVGILPCQTLMQLHKEFGYGEVELGEPDTSEYEIPTWPVIFDSRFDEDLFEDGWHRFQNYCERNMNVPFIWYVD